MRTQGAFFADTAHGGGWVIYAAPNLNLPSAQQGSGASQLAWVRNALGDWSLNNVTVGVATFNVVLSLADEKRLIETAALAQKNLPFQEKFGAAALTPGWPAGAPSLPPFTGLSQLTPPTSDTAKGVQITDVVAFYNVGTANLTAASMSLNRTVFTNNAVRVVTNVAISATALPLVTQAGDYAAVRAVTTPVFENTDLSDLNLELTLTTAATTVLRVYGLGMHFNFNWD